MKVITPALSETLIAVKGGTDSKQIVPVGTRCRLKSIYIRQHETIPNPNGTEVVDFRNGDASDDIMFELEPSVLSMTGFFSLPVFVGASLDQIDFPDIGVLFNNGMHLTVNLDTSITNMSYMVVVIFAR